jgi:hypothetical protein
MLKPYPIINIASIYTQIINGSSRIMIGLKVVNVIVEYGPEEGFMGNFNG